MCPALLGYLPQTACWDIRFKKGSVIAFCTRSEHTDKDEEQGTPFLRFLHDHLSLVAGLGSGLNQDLQD